MTVAAPAMAQNLATNGTFAVTGGSTSFQFGPGQNSSVASESLAGWSTTGGTNDVFIVNSTGAVQDGGSITTLWSPTTGGSQNGFTYKSPTGGNFVGVDTDLGTAAITQTINGLKVGATYAVSFAWAGAQEEGSTGASQEDWQVTFGSSTQTTQATNVASEGFSGWINQTFDFVATSTSEVLSFLGQDPSHSTVPAFALLANASVTQVPEPASMAMLAVGAVGAFGMARSRRARRQSIPMGSTLPS